VFPNPPGFNDKRKMIELLKNSISESINKDNKHGMITTTFDNNNNNKSEVSIVEELDSDDNYN
jgi:transcriptional regulator CtsR